LKLAGDDWKPAGTVSLEVHFIMLDPKTRTKKPVSDRALKAIWSAAGRSTVRAPTDGIVKSGLLLPGHYQLRLESEGGRRSKFGFLGTTKWELDLKASDKSEPIVVEVEPLYTHVRFVAHCLTTIPRQLYQDPDWKAQYVGAPIETEDIEAR